MTCLLLSGCGPDSQATAGSVEIGAAMTCESGSHPECIEVMDEHVLLDSVDFQPAGVESAAAVQQDDREVVEVIFDEHGADVLRAVSTRPPRSTRHAWYCVPPPANCSPPSRCRGRSQVTRHRSPSRRRPTPRSGSS